ncbi:hypothetical protein GJAV_G00273710 [Gymnothorax javanicus]|nr:hypothetical protein GJAV_G00273710 [Gymnothorax javanicus]
MGSRTEFDSAGTPVFVIITIFSAGLDSGEQEHTDQESAPLRSSSLTSTETGDLVKHLRSWSVSGNVTLNVINVNVRSDSLAASSELRLVLVGMSGDGRSSTGNTILGRYKFSAGFSPVSTTQECEARVGDVFGRRVLVVDTPGMYHTRLQNEDFRQEMRRALKLCHPGPHAFLFVIQLGRFTSDKALMMNTLRDIYDKNVHERTIVLITYGDRLGDHTIEDFISHRGRSLHLLLEKCGNRYHVFNNNKMEDRSQVFGLLQKIDKMLASRTAATLGGESEEMIAGDDALGGVLVLTAIPVAQLQVSSAGALYRT